MAEPRTQIELDAIELARRIRSYFGGHRPWKLLECDCEIWDRATELLAKAKVAEAPQRKPKRRVRR